MNILTNERLNKIASWRETYGTNTNVMIPAKEAEELVQRLLTAEKKLAELGRQEPVAINLELDGVDEDCVRDRTGRSDEYCEGFVNGMIEAACQIRDNNPVSQVVSQQEDTLSQIRDILHIGSEVPLFCIVENVKNANRFADHLAGIEQEFFMVPDEEYHTEDDDQNDEPREKCLVNRWGLTTEQYVEQFRKALKHIVHPVQPVASQPSVINLTDEQIDSVLDSRGNILYVIGDKRERLRLFVREILRVASAQLINAVPLHIVPDELPEVPDGDAELDSYNKDKTDS
ncbi:hypothetical protein AACK17_10925 [Pectobacterium punjabense]|uniref:hypothetical protein n=1 Tax=Pectobacterium punjabense TaxID=2108399 RepID=UPI00311DEB41